MKKLAPRAIYQLSRDGFLALKDKLRSLEQERKDLAKRLRTIKADQSTNDIAESLVWLEKVTSFQLLEKEIEKMRSILKSAKVLVTPKKSRRVQLGSRVELATADKHFNYVIVSSLEANPTEGRISDVSPLGQALLGRYISESIEFRPSAKTKPTRFTLVNVH